LTSIVALAGRKLFSVVVMAEEAAGASREPQRQLLARVALADAFLRCQHHQAPQPEHALDEPGIRPCRRRVDLSRLAGVPPVD
jgi:hypothetical protein